MDILDKFLEYLKNNYKTTNQNENNTVNAYYSDVKQFFKYYEEQFGEKFVIFQRSNVIEYKDYLIEKGYKYSTINRKLAALSIYENFLIESEIKNDAKKIKKADFYTIERPFVTADMMPRKTIRKIKQKAEEMNIRDYLILVILDNGGLRVSELVKLELERDIDMEGRKITILGKGNKIRMIIIDELMYEVLNDYIPYRKELLNGRKNKYLLVSNKTVNTNSPMGRTSINNILKKYCDILNEKSINPHLLRHDCATKWYEEGYSDLMMKKFLGHSSDATEIYTHQGGERSLIDKK